MATRSKGFVLAGGLSSRFGEDKGRRFGVHVLRAMEAAGIEAAFVARDDRLADLGPVLVEPPGPVHPLSGLIAGLEAGGTVFAPCDLPFLPSEAFARLEMDSVAKGCPLLGKLGPTWIDRATMYRDEGRSVRAFVQPLRTIVMPSEWLRNVNRPSDLDTRTP